MWTGGTSLEGLAPINQLFQFKSAPPQIFLTGLILVGLSLFRSVCCSSLTSRETNQSMLRIVVFYVIKLLYFLTSWSRLVHFARLTSGCLWLTRTQKPSLTTCCVRLHRMKANQHDGHVSGWKIFNSVSVPIMEFTARGGSVSPQASPEWWIEEEGQWLQAQGGRLKEGITPATSHWD